jgi:hypothetical protein
MKLLSSFTGFMQDTVNINKTRLSQLSARVDAIYDALRADEIFGPYVLGKIPQGSWPQRTIIKPLEDHEFDADFLLVLKENPEWSPKRYTRELFKALGRTNAYKDMRSEKCRCVRVTYANDCHIDVVPFVELADGRRMIVNAEQDAWENSDPEGFTKWMKEKDDASDGQLRKVIRLVKYLRDHKGTFDGTRSILLTTLLGERVSASNKLFDTAYYGDLPTALKNIVNDLDVWLQANPTKPQVADPSGCGASFDHRWTQVTYSNFRNMIHTYAAAITDAYNEADQEKCLEKWRKVFGEGFKDTNKANSESTGRYGVPVAATSASRSGRAG